MAKVGKGLLALNGPVIDGRAVLNALAKHRASDWVLCRAKDAGVRDWSALSARLLARRIEELLRARGKTNDKIRISELLADPAMRQNVTKVVSPVVAHTDDKYVEVVGRKARPVALHVDLANNQTLHLALPLKTTIRMASDLLDAQKGMRGEKTPKFRRGPFSFVEVFAAPNEPSKLFVGDVVIGNKRSPIPSSKFVFPLGKPLIASRPATRGGGTAPPMLRMRLFADTVAAAFDGGFVDKDTGSAGQMKSDPTPLSDFSSGECDEPTAATPAATPDGTGTVEAFPHITPDSLHVVQRQNVTITVSLAACADPAVAGSLGLPVGEHTLQTHVLLGSNDAWSKLTYNTAIGTRQPAVVTLRVPSIKGDREEFPIVANFYLNGRWCGEGRRLLEVLARPGVDPNPDPERPADSPWKSILRLAPGDTPPDLLVRIQSLGARQYKFILLSPHANLTTPGEVDAMSLSDDDFRFVKSNFSQIAGAQLDDDAIVRIKGRLREIYDSTPPAFKSGYWSLARLVAAGTKTSGGQAPSFDTIQFVSDEPYVPWDLMLVRGEKPGDPEHVLSIKHAVGRWSAQSWSQLRPELFVRDIKVFASDYRAKSTVPPLPWAEDERNFLTSTPYGAKPGLLKRDAVLEFFRDGGAQVVHFSCHGLMDVQVPSKSTLVLEDGDLTKDYLEDPKWQKGLRREHPLVFLNACQVGAPGKTLAIVTGWPQGFLDAGAAACIAPLWNVVDSTARDVAEEFYRRTFHEHSSAGEALQQIKRQWEEKRSLTYLGYALYGDPAMKIIRDLSPNFI